MREFDCKRHTKWKEYVEDPIAYNMKIHSSPAKSHTSFLVFIIEFLNNNFSSPITIFLCVFVERQ